MRCHLWTFDLRESISFFCCARMSSLFAKLFRSSRSSTSITRYSSTCALYFSASRLQCVTSRSRLPTRRTSRARPASSARRHSSFYDRSNDRSREPSRERRSELAFEWADLTDRLECALLSCPALSCCFSWDFLEVTESRTDFFSCEGRLLGFSLEYLGLRTDSTSVAILTSGAALAGLGRARVLTVRRAACSRASCFLRSTARCTSAKSSLSSSSSSSSSSPREGQEQTNLLELRSLGSWVKRAVSWLGGSRGGACLGGCSSSEEREMLSILRSSSISLRSSSLISLFFCLISPSRAPCSTTPGRPATPPPWEVQRSSSLSLREAEEERGAVVACSSSRSSASCICERRSLEEAPFIQIKLLQRARPALPSCPPLLPLSCSCPSPAPRSKPSLLRYNQLIGMQGASDFWKKALAFGLTFLGYASLHALREGWSYSKAQVEGEFGVSGEFLGIVDALYLMSYSLGMAALGSVIHRVSLKTYIITGLLLASLAYAFFPLLFAATGFFSPVLTAVAMCMNGFFQATGWPGMMGIFGNWFQKNKKGVLMGLWAMNANVGNIIASSLCNLLETHQLSWVCNFALTAAFAVAVALLMLLLLKEKPDDPHPEQHALLNQERQEQEARQAQEAATRQAQEEEAAGLSQPSMRFGIFSVMCLPRVPLYVLGYSCLKGCIYGLLFWLPVFFEGKGGDIAAEKGYIASMIDLGSLVGGTAVGFLVDRYNKRALFLSPLLLMSAVVMFVVSFAPSGAAWTYYLAMFLIGNCIGGPYNIIGTVIAIDIGNNIREKGSVTKVSSLIEGSAAFFTAISMVFIPRIPFDAIFYLFAAECIIATLALLPLFLQELRTLLAYRRAHTHTHTHSQISDSPSDALE